jgi:general stress protein 26
MSHQDEKKNDITQLVEKIKDVRIAMMTTIGENGSLESRPMATQEIGKDGILWFFTYADAPKVGEVEQHQQVNISYAKPDANLFVSVAGTAELVRDQKKIKELWKPLLKAWFPGGEDDPRLALLKVQVDHAEYWDAPSGKMGGLFASLKGHASEGKDFAGNDVKLNMH